MEKRKIIIAKHGNGKFAKYHSTNKGLNSLLDFLKKSGYLYANVYQSGIFQKRIYF